MQSEYKIIPFSPELFDQVGVLLRYLIKDDPDTIASYFRWKYYDNPYSDGPLGIVSLYQDEVVGFKGFFATKWHIPGKGYKFIVLCPGDLCVHPNHRRLGLSVAMGNLGMDIHASKYPLFLVTSSGKNSLPGSRRMGFVPLTEKRYLRRKCSSLKSSPLDNHSGRMGATGLSGGRIRFGEFGDIIVAEKPRPRQMVTLISRQDQADDTIMLFQDEKFFQWRFGNKRNTYVFYYCKEGAVMTGYVVLALSNVSVNPGYVNGMILDCAGISSGTLEKILRFIIEAGHVDMLSIWDCCLNEHSLRILKDMNFKPDGLLKRIRKRLAGTPQSFLLVRPVKRSCSESDWFIQGLDIRKPGSWVLKGVCSDAL